MGKKNSPSGTCVIYEFPGWFCFVVFSFFLESEERVPKQFKQVSIVGRAPDILDYKVFCKWFRIHGIFSFANSNSRDILMCKLPNSNSWDILMCKF